MHSRTPCYLKQVCLQFLDGQTLLPANLGFPHFDKDFKQIKIFAKRVPEFFFLVHRGMRGSFINPWFYDFYFWPLESPRRWEWVRWHGSKIRVCSNREQSNDSLWGVLSFSPLVEGGGDYIMRNSAQQVIQNLELSATSQYIALPYGV